MEGFALARGPHCDKHFGLFKKIEPKYHLGAVCRVKKLKVFFRIPGKSEMPKVP